MAGIVLYSRKNCPLCDKAKAKLEATRVAFTEIDISTDPGLEAEFGITIPVVQLDGIPIFEAGMDPDDLSSLVTEGEEAGPLQM